MVFFSGLFLYTGGTGRTGLAWAITPRNTIFPISAHIQRYALTSGAGVAQSGDGLVLSVGYGVLETRYLWAGSIGLGLGPYSRSKTDTVYLLPQADFESFSGRIWGAIPVVSVTSMRTQHQLSPLIGLSISDSTGKYHTDVSSTSAFAHPAGKLYVHLWALEAGLLWTLHGCPERPTPHTEKDLETRFESWGLFLQVGLPLSVTYKFVKPASAPPRPTQGLFSGFYMTAGVMGFLGI